jgi:hypothetical protein
VLKRNRAENLENDNIKISKPTNYLMELIMFNHKELAEEEKLERLRNQYIKINPPPIPFSIFQFLPNFITAPYMMKMMNYIMSHID